MFRVRCGYSLSLPYTLFPDAVALAIQWNAETGHPHEVILCNERGEFIARVAEAAPQSPKVEGAETYPDYPD
jgi:hypothetical protein